MKISREDFYELYDKYVEAWDMFHEHENYYQQIFLDELSFSLFYWLEEKLNLRNPDALDDFRPLHDLYYYEVNKNKPWKLKTFFHEETDIDEVYDKYMKEVSADYSYITKEELEELRILQDKIFSFNKVSEDYVNADYLTDTFFSSFEWLGEMLELPGNWWDINEDLDSIYEEYTGGKENE